MVCITKDLSTKVLNDRILLITWESDDLDVDLSPLTDKDIMYAIGTFSQIMNLIKICTVRHITITGKLSLEQLSILEEMQNLHISITDIRKFPVERLNYVMGQITNKSSKQATNRLLIVCKRISVDIKNNNSLFDLICSHANKIRILHLYSSIDYMRILIPKLTNLHQIKLPNIDQEIINILGESYIKHIFLLRCSTTLNITPIITNPMIESLSLISPCVYDINANITLLEFWHSDEVSYQDLRERCIVNKEADFLQKMANIKTPNEI